MRAFETGRMGRPEIAPLPAKVPGSVRGALLRAGRIPDPYRGADSRASEFIEHRHWIFRTTVDVPAAAADARIVLTCESIDGAGEIWVDGECVAEFAHAFVPVEADLTAAAGRTGVELALVFTTPPSSLGQVGWTSENLAWKPRFYYGWDWTPRLVQIGVPGAIAIEVRSSGRPQLAALSIDFIPLTPGHDGRVSGAGVVTGRVAASDDRSSVAARLSDARGETVATGQTVDGVFELRAEVAGWWNADHPRYRLEIAAERPGADAVAVFDGWIGFRQLEWLHTAGAPSDAEPWICVVDGTPIFLRGVNWVPVRPDYADVDDAEIVRRVQTYRDLGFNLIRVWGGAALERPAFYEECDRLGMLVWQELPLSSSGLDNCPPDDPAFAAEFARIARSYAVRLRHHPSLALWSGGNELAGVPHEPYPPGIPITAAHPTIAAAESTLDAVDPGRKFVPTSPSGPRFGADDPDERGKGLHHDVHGPWSHSGPVETWQAYWAADDAMLRSEVGIAGASGADILDAYGWRESTGGLAELWAHAAAWWLTGTEDGSDEWIEQSQSRQAELLAIAARESLARFPACAGFIVWMGHDAFPCPVSLSVLDFWGRPKPAAQALADLFGSLAPRH